MIIFKMTRAALMAGGAVACVSQAAYAQTLNFDVPAQAAVTSIPLFARQAGVQILAPADQLSGVNTPAVKGVFGRAQALQLLLKGTPLFVASDDGATVVLKVGAKAKLESAVNAAAAAQPDPATQDVVVTSYRASLASSQTVKRRAVGVEDVISADDIAGFPDLNLAEALQRIPGVVITRDAGEGRQIALRGLGPDFTRTQLNGMEVLTNTASGMDNRGNVSRTRAFDYSMFASELFDRVTVQKSYAAEQDEGGVGGTVQLSTAKPFDYAGAEAVLSAKAQTNTNTDGVTPRIVGLISNRWDNGFGALLSVAYSENKSNEYGYRNYAWGQIKVNAANIGPGVSASDAALLESGEVFAPQANTLSTWYTDRKRLGVTTSLQYHPDSRLNLDFDFLYGKLTNDRDDYALTTSGTNPLTGNITAGQLINSVVIQNNTLVYGDYSHIGLRSEHNNENDNTNFYQGVLNGKYKISDNLTATGMVGVSRSAYALPVYVKAYLESLNHNIITNDMSLSPSNSYDTITDPSAWNLMRADAQQNGIISEYHTAKGDLAYSFDKSNVLKFGAMYKDFSNTGWQRYYKQFYNSPTDLVIPASMKGTFSADSYAPYVVGDIYSIYNYVGKSVSLAPAYNQPGSNYAVEEKTGSAYVQYDKITELFGYFTRANAGVRYYQTELTSSGTQTVGSVLEPVSVTHDYHDFLPAANIAVTLNDDTVLRFSADRNVSRPALSDLAAAATVNNSALGGSISAGNPNLKPMTANSAEASLEYYQGQTGYASIGVFYKDMESFVTSETSTVAYGSTGYPLSYLLPGQTGSILYSYSRPVNSKGATIDGIEGAVQRDFDFLPAPFDKFGGVINATYVDGKQRVILGGVSYWEPLFNLSKYSVNATLYYATKTWDARLSLAYRDKYLTDGGSASNFFPGAGNIGDGNTATTNIDFAAHYNVNAHLKLVLEGINLTNQAIIQYSDMTAQRPLVYTRAGSTYTVGASYQF